eukprot:6160873-Prymnesium_polylepis.1
MGRCVRFVGQGPMDFVRCRGRRVGLRAVPEAQKLGRTHVLTRLCLLDLSSSRTSCQRQRRTA